MSHLRRSWGMDTNDTWVSPTPILFRLYKAFRILFTIADNNLLNIIYWQFTFKTKNLLSKRKNFREKRYSTNLLSVKI